MKTNKKNTFIFLFLLTASVLSCAQKNKKNQKSETSQPSQSSTSEEKQEPKISPVQKITQEIDFTPADKNASQNVKILMQYFAEEVYGKKIITGIMDCAWSDKINMNEKVHSDTGYYAALTGYDFIMLTKDDSKTWYHPTQVEKAKSWWNKGGLVAFCWHWLNPVAKSGNGASYKPEEISFRIPWNEKTKTLDTNSNDFSYIKKDLDTVAGYLDELQKAGVVVIWRPLHEARGNYGTVWGNGSVGDAWFWWGASGPEPYIALYRYMFKYFTEEKNLHNLIWLWNGQGEQWYPGDDVVDLVGYDIYDDRNSNGAGESYFKDLLAWSGSKKMACISEGGYIPSSVAVQRSSASWLYYMIWNDNDNLLDDSQKDNDNFWGGTKFNSKEMKTVYSFDTDYQIKLGDESLKELFKKMK